MEQNEFEHMMLRLRGKLLSLASRFNDASVTHVDPEDIVQETLLTIWKLSRGEYPIRNTEALAVKILKTNCVAASRRSRLRLSPMDGIECETGSSQSASSIVDMGDARDLEARLFGLLTATQREIIRLNGACGLSLDEISQLTGKPKTSVKTTISSARRKMFEYIKEHEL